MLSYLVIGLLALVMFAYLAVPLLFPQLSDPLPNRRDPLEQDLEEERDALLRAIRELDARDDLAESRRAELRARYEAKAAKVLRALDTRQAELQGQPVSTATPAPRRFPFVMLTLLGLMVTSAAVLSGYVIPRVGDETTVTTADAATIQAGRELQTLQRAAQNNPSVDTLRALGDRYWQLGDAEQAAETYDRLVNEFDDAPAVTYRRLGLIALQQDVERAVGYLEEARARAPTDPDTLVTLGEVYYALGRIGDAQNAWQTYLATPQGAGDEQVVERLEQAQSIAPLVEAVNTDPSADTLLALADAYWQRQERERAADVYFRLLTEIDPNNAQATSRIGQILFFSGRNDDAIALLERARILDNQNLQTLLFLGNAYYSQDSYQAAIDVWQEYVVVAGGADAAGRVPGLIEDAQAQLNGGAPAGATGPLASADAPSGASQLVSSGQQVYAANCAACHGSVGQGGSGPRLANNSRAADTNRVHRIVSNGQGMMPAYEFVLSADELDAVVTYVTDTLAPGGATSNR
ncbi:MAG: c-type cytochrome [Trueperaceae bacterium]|nr:c-type cytochrome [Trueperaceae bacterium]